MGLQQKKSNNSFTYTENISRSQMTSEKSDSEIVSACKELIRKFKAGEEPTQDDVEFVMSSNLLKQNMRYVYHFHLMKWPFMFLQKQTQQLVFIVRFHASRGRKLSFIICRSKLVCRSIAI